MVRALDKADAMLMLSSAL